MKKLLILFVLLISLVGCSSFNKKIYTDDEIIAAVIVDDVYMLNRAIKNGFNINEELKSGDTLLSLALKEDSLQIFSSLLT
ncbi:MAG: ankyrin repeat domain-containing protein, partial [Cetobacterium sp.]